jgi:hypothetical protein
VRPRTTSKSFEKFLRGFERTSFELGKFGFRWNKLSTKCLSKNGLSQAVYSPLSLSKSEMASSATR